MEKNSLSPSCELVIIAGSAGSLEVILNALSRIRPDISLAIIILLHRSNEPEPLLQFILSSKTSIPVMEIEEKDPIQPGHIYIAPADYHLLIEKDHSFSLDYSEKVNFSRPSIDVTLEIAADVYGPSLACILLSGGNSDGTNGLMAVKQAGGIVAIQDPTTAFVPFMPQHAASKMQIDFILPANEIAAFINKLG